MKKLLRIILIIIIIILAVVSPFVQKGYSMYKEAIDAVPIEDKVNEIKASESYTTLNEIPQIYKDAVVAAEDHRFLYHHGVDVISIGRAIINDIKAMSLVEGGSTITQQLCKNIYFTQEKKIERKIAEIFMAIDMEKKYEKDDILELYINTAYYGSGCYNIKDAAMEYFGKLPMDMTDNECILLAGVPNAPSVYSPKVNPELALQRQMQVVNKMIEYGYLSSEQADKILQEE